MRHQVVTDLLGAWALEGCDAAETAAVEQHLHDCPACTAQAERLRAAVGWIGVDRVVHPPPELRQATLARARAVRRPVLLVTLAQAYGSQVERLDQLLDTVTPSDLERADPRHGSLGGVLAHLAANDRALAEDLHLPAARGAGPVPGRWRGQARILLDGLAYQNDPDRLVPMAGRDHPPRRALRYAVVQRAFETWTHHDDLARTLGGSAPTPPPEQIRRIVALAVDLLPQVLRADGVSRPGRCGRLSLTGVAGGDWVVPLGPATPPDSTVEFTIRADSLDFVRLVANRHPVAALRHRVEGDTVLAARVLRVASTLGCD